MQEKFKNIVTDNNWDVYNNNWDVYPIYIDMMQYEHISFEKF